MATNTKDTTANKKVNPLAGLTEIKDFYKQPDMGIWKMNAILGTAGAAFGYAVLSETDPTQLAKWAFGPILAYHLAEALTRDTKFIAAFDQGAAEHGYQRSRVIALATFGGAYSYYFNQDLQTSAMYSAACVAGFSACTAYIWNRPGMGWNYW